MKIIIWGGWLLIVTLLNLLLGELTGVRFGFILLYLLVIFPARAMCKWWDWRTANQSVDCDAVDNEPTAETEQ